MRSTLHPVAGAGSAEPLRPRRREQTSGGRGTPTAGVDERADANAGRLLGNPAGAMHTGPSRREKEVIGHARQ